MASQAVVTTDETESQAIIRVQTQLADRANEYAKVLPSHITPDKFQRTVLTAIQSDPELLAADRRSLLTACMKAAQDGLLPDKREAALVIFNNRMKDAQGAWVTVKEAQYMPMVYGLRKKILQSGEVKDIFANVVYRQEIEDGLFLYEEGTERMLRHKPLLDPKFDPSDDDIVCAYSIATFEDGSQSFEVMRRAEINKVRQKSQTGATGKTTRDGKPIAPKGPWVEWFSEMAKKTVMRRHSKVLPMSGDIIDVEAFDQALHARSTQAVLAAVPSTPPQRIEDQAEAWVADQLGQVANAADGDTLDAIIAGGHKAVAKLAREHADLHAQMQAAYEQRGAELNGYDTATGEVVEQASGSLFDAPDPRQAKADEIIAACAGIKTKAELEALKDLYEADINALPDELVPLVAGAIDGAAGRAK